MDAELMGGCRRIREVDYSLRLGYFPNKIIILTYYMLNTWWLHIMDVLVHCIIRLGLIEQFLVMTNNIMTLVYTYSKLGLNKPPDVFYKLAHNGRLISCIPSRLA